MTCPRCGAENQPNAKICRMCATPLDVGGMAAAPPKPNPFPNMPSMGIPPASFNPIVPPSSSAPGPGEVLCATCKAVNDASWAYCQQCGSQLHKLSKPAAPPMPPPQPVMQSMPKPPAFPSIPSLPPVPPRPPMAPPMSMSPMMPPPMPPLRPLTPPAAPAVMPMGNPVRNDGMGSNNNMVTCNSCGRLNTQGSSFCATCGAALPAEQTLMMGARNVAVTPKLRLIQEGGGDGELYKLDQDEITIGRNSGDIRFPHDGYMSGRHARILRRGDNFILVDENSRNGTFKRIDGEVELKAGDIILIGKQLFRFEL